MVKRHTKHDDGKYHINGRKYDLLEGSRAQVWHRTAYRTSGGLTHADLKQNEEGRIVSRAKSRLGKSQKHLGSHLQPKGSGKFGPKTAKKGGSSCGTKKGGSSCATHKGGSSCATHKGGRKTQKRRKSRRN
jgi:hypothetical protein